MNFSADFIEYNATGYFSKIVTDYLAADKKLLSFYQHPVSLDGIQAAIEERKKYPTDRVALHAVIKKQYTKIKKGKKVSANIEKLLLENTFTITTAHQPNIFTGPLYFIYKILHTIKLAEYLGSQIANTHFVPIYFMGSEDADIEELGHVYVNGEKYEWETAQTGAVGRMKIDAAFIQLIKKISGQLTVYSSGNEIMNIVADCYQEGATIAQATFKFVNALFSDYGLVVLLPDNAALKQLFVPIIKKELLDNFSYKCVEETIDKFPPEYKPQVNGRAINLFYLKDNARARIEFDKSQWRAGSQVWTAEALMQELKLHPERFSPNVVLRPVFQEMILPNIVFIGGGGELAYWLELKKVFGAVAIPYPVLLLRNSFLIVDKEVNGIKEKLSFSTLDLFQTETELVKKLVLQESEVQLSLEKERLAVGAFFQQLKRTASAVDITLQNHIESLKSLALKKIVVLEKKMLRAEKKKFDAEQRHLQKLKGRLFPNNNLQERIENIMFFYAKWGSEFIKNLYAHSLALEQKFGMFIED